MPFIRLACWLLTFGSAAVHAAEGLSVEAERKGSYIQVSARATVDARLSIIWTTLTDYERLPEFIPGLKTSRIVSRNGPVVVVEQSGEARFLMFSFPIDVTLRAVESPRSAIRVHALSGNVRYLDGGYSVEPDSDGPKFVLHWMGTIAPDVSLPAFFGELVMRMSIEDQFTGMVREIERREMARRSIEKDRPKK